MSDLTKTEHGARIGTPLYFSPEQIKGNKRDIEHRTDLFAAGILLYFAATGRHPFFSTDMLQTTFYEMVLESEIHWEDNKFKALPRELQLLLKKLLAKSRADRPHDASQVANILRKICGGAS